MQISKKAQEIMDILYRIYGTDSGIIFGITSSKIVGVIVQFTLEHSGNDEIFISHIQNHLQEGQNVVCKICGKTAVEIISEEKRRIGSGKLTLNDVPPPQEADMI
jgi:hypothetical protein